MAYLVFDIETVPDSTMWKPTPPKSARSKKMEDQVAPVYAQRPIAIGFLQLDDELHITNFGCVQSDDEPALIKNFSDWVATIPATLVSFNGRRFDVPCLGFRAIRHGLAQRYNTAAHRRRYDEEHHLDLFDALTEYGSLGFTNFGLDVISQLIGLPSKGPDDKGRAIEALYTKGEHAKINGHCRQDVARQTFVLLRYLLMRGRITLDAYRLAALTLFELCKAEKLMGLTFGVDQQRLLLADPSPPQPEAQQQQTEPPTATA